MSRCATTSTRKSGALNRCALWAANHARASSCRCVVLSQRGCDLNLLGDDCRRGETALVSLPTTRQPATSTSGSETDWASLDNGPWAIRVTRGGAAGTNPPCSRSAERMSSGRTAGA